MLEFDAIVRGLEAVGVPKARAEAEARRQLGMPAAGVESPDEAAMREKLEAEHTAEGDKLMRALGFEVVRLEQRRASKIQAGLPDRKYYHRRRRLTLWWEGKAEWGRQRPDQREFQAMAEACGETYVLGKLESLKTWLVDAGVATREGELLIPTPIADKTAGASAA